MSTNEQLLGEKGFFHSVRELVELNKVGIKEIIVDEETWNRIGEQFISEYPSPRGGPSLEDWKKQIGCRMYGILIKKEPTYGKEDVRRRILHEIDKLIKKIDSLENEVCRSQPKLEFFRDERII